MRILVAAILTVVLPAPLLAQDERKPNTLTSKEVSDGWLLLFDGQSTFGWQIKGQVKVENGLLVLGGDSQPVIAQYTAWFGACDLTLETKTSGSKAPSLALTNGKSAKAYPLMKQKAGADGVRESQLWHQHYFGVSYSQEITTQDVRVEGKILGTSSAWEQKMVPDADPRGPVSLWIEVPAGTTLTLRNVKLMPAYSQLIFTGKTLAGWHEFPGKKSKFSVTPEGWLNVKDGPGDLQTKGKYDDFILQLDCISNGKHLNSGIFFRCLPDQYQMGYEAQIRNQFTKEPTQKYSLEEYDPMTHKLLGKKDIMGTAVDYGTGAIYRRVPARQDVAKDGEWFTMTVVAHGNHFATWVNGVQVVDWTDNRPLSENARKGQYLQAGHISIQGHDPTTDLSFRNLRIAPLPRAK